MLIKEKFDNEVELDREKVRKMVPQRFHKWLKVFKKVKSERILVRKPWDHAINLREDFVPRKERTYLMSREEKEVVREFVEEQLRKGYIRPQSHPRLHQYSLWGKRTERKEWYRTINT